MPGTKSKFYTIPRRKGDEQWINDYNPAILLAWRANTDLQLVSTDLIHIQNYVAGYSTKSEASKGNNLLKEMLGKQINNKDMWRIFIDLLALKDQGAMEMCDILLGHNLYEFDVGHIFINTNPDAKRFRFLKSKKCLQNDDEKTGYETNWYDNYYPDRIECLEQFSLINLMINFDVRKIMLTIIFFFIFKYFFIDSNNNFNK